MTRRVLTSTLLVALAITLAITARATRRPMRYAIHVVPAEDRVLQLARAAGFDTVVCLFSWREIEPTRGEFHWQRPDEIVNAADYYGLDLVVRLDHHPAWASDAPFTINAPPDNIDDYAQFVYHVAERYRGRVLAYIIWNEPNLAIEWGGRQPSPEEYAALLREAYFAVKRADPAALVVSAGLASTNHNDAQAMDDRLFLEGMYRAGAQPHFDVLGAHPYGFGQPPDDPRGAHEGLNMARLEDLREIMVRHGDADKPIWATEMGWRVDGPPQETWQVVSRQEQAQYLVNAFEMAPRRWPWLELMAVWNLGGESDPQWEGYSLLEADGRPRPAYEALKRMRKGWSARELRFALRAAWEKAVQRWGRARVQILAQDAPFHLGDSDYSTPWRPLFGARHPSTRWEGTFYLRDPGVKPWKLTMVVMQSNVWNNRVWLNGRPLSPPLPTDDFSSTWVSVKWEVPPAWLRPGANQLAITIGQTLPLLQDVRFSWDDVQVKDIVLYR